MKVTGRKDNNITKAISKKSLVGFIAGIAFFVALLFAALNFNGGEERELLSEYTGEDFKNDLMAAIYESDISLIKQAILEGDLTCVEVTEFYLARIEKYNDKYNCFITLCDDALDKAAEKDELIKEGKAEGLLFGVPFVIKDNMDYAGYETTDGYEKGTFGTEERSAFVVQKLVDEGAIILGKTNMSTDAQYASNSESEAVGDTRNAYNTKFTPGGSSGGSAAAVSLNFAAAGLGTDTSSSLRIPAVFNGDVALRVSTGLIDRTGIIELSEHKDVPGVIARSVKDNALVLDVLTENKYHYLNNLDSGAIKGKRIGIIKELTDREYLDKNKIDYDENILLVFDNAVEELKEMGAELIEISLPVYYYEDIFEGTDSEYYRNKFYSEYKQELEDDNLDAVIHPSCLKSDLPIANEDERKFTNCCHLLSPEIGVADMAVTIGYLPNGTGIGMEIVTDRNGEQPALDMAYSYTLKYNHRKVPKGAPNLYESISGSDLCTLIKLSNMEEKIRLFVKTPSPVKPGVMS